MGETVRGKRSIDMEQLQEESAWNIISGRSFYTLILKKKTLLQCIVAADLDGNEKLDYAEAMDYLHTRKKRNVENERAGWFERIDSNSDGFLTVDEIDSDE